MCDPVTAGALMMGGGAVMGGFGAYKGQQSQNSALEYNARILENNAKVSEMQAKAAEGTGKIEEKQHRLKLSQLEGSQRAAFAGSGVAMDTGSAADVIKDTQKWGEMDALTMRRNTALQAWGYRAQGSEALSQASLARSQKRSPWEAGGLALLSGGSQMGATMMMA